MTYQRKEVIGDAVLYLGDCFEVMRALDPVDHVITDPPYGERTHSRQQFGRRGAKYADGWVTTKGLNYEGFSADQVRAASNAFRLLAKKWVLVMTSHDLFPVWESALDGYTFAPLPIVMKGMNVRLAGDGPSSWTCWLTVNRPVGYRDGTKPGAYIGTLGAGPERAANPVKGHKPVWLMEELLRDYTQIGDSILDPFLGSGTTAVACNAMGRKSVGIERDPASFDYACERIDQAQRQQRLFA